MHSQTACSGSAVSILLPESCALMVCFLHTHNFSSSSWPKFHVGGHCWISIIVALVIVKWKSVKTSDFHGLILRILWSHPYTSLHKFQGKDLTDKQEHLYPECATPLYGLWKLNELSGFELLIKNTTTLSNIIGESCW